MGSGLAWCPGGQFGEKVNTANLGLDGGRFNLQDGMGEWDEARPCQDIERREQKIMGGMEGFKAIPSGHVWWKCMGSDAVQNGVLRNGNQVLQLRSQLKMVAEIGGIGVQSESIRGWCQSSEFL